MRKLAIALAVGVLMTGCGNGDSGNDTTPQATPSVSDSSADSPCLTSPSSDVATPGIDVDQFIGLSLADAKRLAKNQDLTTRLAGEDGDCYALTMDYRTDRVNLYVENGVVTVATNG